MKIMKIKDICLGETEIYRVTDGEAEIIEKFINLGGIEDALDSADIEVSIECQIDIKDF